MAILISVVTSVLGLAWGIIEDNREMAIENRQEIVKNRANIDLIPPIYKNQIKICTALNVDCQ
jgi:hypothetical protein